jgi:hypothetical protein
MLPFLAPVAVGAFRTTDPDRMAAGGDVVSFSPPESGDLGRVVPFPLVPAVKKGDPVRLIVDGVPVREGGLLGRLIEGLSHEEKKSSSASPAGVDEPSAGVPETSLMTTSSGQLDDPKST